MTNLTTYEEKEKYKNEFEKDIILNELLLCKLEILGSLSSNNETTKNITRCKEILDELRETSKNLTDEQIESIKKFDQTHNTYYCDGLKCFRPRVHILDVEFRMEKIEQRVGRVVRLNKN